MGIGDGDYPFGRVSVVLLDVFLHDSAGYSRLGGGAGLGDNDCGYIPLGHEIHELGEIFLGKVVSGEYNFRGFLRSAELLGEIV